MSAQEVRQKGSLFLMQGNSRTQLFIQVFERLFILEGESALLVALMQMSFPSESAVTYTPKKTFG